MIRGEESDEGVQTSRRNSIEHVLYGVDRSI